MTSKQDVHRVQETTKINPAYLEDASGLRGYAGRPFVPEDEKGVAEVLQRATGERIPVTGAGTGVSVGRVPQGGWMTNHKATKRKPVRPATFGYMPGYYPKLVGTALKGRIH